MRDVLGIRILTDDQRALVRSVQDNPRTLGQSGHSSGKTFIDAAIGLSFLYLYPGSEVIVTSSSMWQVKNRLWAAVSTLFEASKKRLGGGDLTATQLKIPHGKMSAVATKTPSNIQGGHEGHVLIVIDEAQAVDNGIWDAAESMMGGPHARTLCTFNPLFAGGAAHQATRKPREWKTVRLSCMTHPNVVTGRRIIPNAVTREWVEERRLAWGEDSPLFQSRVLGEFPETTEDTVISLSDLEACADIRRPLPGDGMRVSLDVARYGSDSDWCTIVEDGRVIAERSWSGLDTMRTVGNLSRIVDEYDVPWERVSIDVGGVGGGCVDRCVELNRAVGAVNFGGGAIGDWDVSPYGAKLGIDGTLFLNRKAELYWTLRALLKKRMFSIPRKFERMWEDLLAMRYETRSDGKIKMESKDEMKKRIGRSPDAGDSVVIALSREGSESAANIVEWV